LAKLVRHERAPIARGRGSGARVGPARRCRRAVRALAERHGSLPAQLRLGQEEPPVSFPDSAVVQRGHSDSLVRYVKNRAGHDRRYAIDCSKIEREGAFAPRVALEDGLRATVGWYVKHAQLPGVTRI